MFALAALLALTSPLAQEWAALPPLPGFAAVYRRTGANGSVEEWVPQGESFTAWSRMITRQQFNVATTPRDFAERLARNWIGACPGSSTSAITGVGAFVEQRLDCPRNPQTGKPETMFLRAYAGTGAVHAVQIAFRSVPSAAETAWAKRQLAAIALCRGVAAGACSMPPATTPLG